MAQQKALLVTGPGDRIVLGTRPIPTPGPKEVLVKVAIAGCMYHSILAFGTTTDLASKSS